MSQSGVTPIKRRKSQPEGRGPEARRTPERKRTTIERKRTRKEKNAV